MLYSMLLLSHPLDQCLLLPPLVIAAAASVERKVDAFGQ